MMKVLPHVVGMSGLVFLLDAFGDVFEFFKERVNQRNDCLGDFLGCFLLDFFPLVPGQSLNAQLHPLQPQSQVM